MCDIETDPANPRTEELKQLQDYFLNQGRPLKFNPHAEDSVLRTNEMQFEDIVTTMEENGVTYPKKLTEFEFFSKINYYDKKFKAMNK